MVSVPANFVCTVSAYSENPTEGDRIKGLQDQKILVYIYIKIHSVHIYGLCKVWKITYGVIAWIIFTVNFRSLKYRKAVLWYTLPRRITWNLKVLVFLKTILVKVYLLLSICWNYCMSVYLWAIWGNIVLQNFSLLFWKLNAENSAFL